MAAASSPSSSLSSIFINLSHPRLEAARNARQTEQWSRPMGRPEGTTMRPMEGTIQIKLCAPWKVGIINGMARTQIRIQIQRHIINAQIQISTVTYSLQVLWWPRSRSRPWWRWPSRHCRRSRPKPRFPLQRRARPGL